MTVIQEITLDPPIREIHFACNLGQCKGACCTMPGGLGAPLLPEEIAEIEKAFPQVQKYLSVKHLQAIEERGLVDSRFSGYVTPCVDNRACAYVYYEGEIAKCSFEKAYLKGETKWRKPLSCHLFPIRVDGGSKTIRYEPIPECDPALANGRHLKIPLSKFLEEPLIRAFGQEWYDEFLKEQQIATTAT